MCILFPTAARRDSQKENPDGTGPFKLVSWERNSEIRFERFADYWDTANVHLNSITWRFFSDDATMITALQSGEVDAIMRVSPSSVEALEATGKYNVYDAPSNNYATWFNCSDPTVGDVNVRQAIKYALDCDQLCQATDQYGKVSAYPMAVGTSAYYTDQFNWEQDLDKAKSYLAESGINASDITLTICGNTQPMDKAYAEAVQYQLMQLGFNVKMDMQDVATFCDNWVAGTFQMLCSALPLDCPDPSANAVRYITNGPKNHYYYSNTEYDKLFTQATQTIDFDTQKDLYIQANEILLNQDVPVIYTNQDTTEIVVSNKISGVVVLPAMAEFKYCSKS